MSGINGVSHIALNTADMGRFRRFYEGVLGLRMGVTAVLDHPPHLRHATFHVTDGLVLHVFEVPGYDPAAQGIGTDIGERGRVDHFGLNVPDEAALREVAERLRAAGATDGEVRHLGPTLSVHVTDPDGLQLEVTCPDLEWDPDDPTGERFEEVGLPDWLPRMRAAALVGPHP